MFAKFACTLNRIIGQRRLTHSHRHHFDQISPQISKNIQSILGQDSITWPIIISELVSLTQVSHTALRKAAPLFPSGSNLNAYSLVHLIRACANTAGLFSNGEQLHGLIIKSGFTSNVFVSTAMVHFYAKHERLSNAHNLFDEMSDPSLVSWNTLLSGYIHSGQFRKALNLFVQLEKSNNCADSYSFTAVLSACGQLSLVQMGRSVHSKIVRHGVECSVYVSNCLIDMYGKCGYAPDAVRVFDAMIEKDIITWNSILAANARNGELAEAFAIFYQMPNHDTISHNQLIDGVARFGAVEDAVTLLSRMPSPNSSSWNSIITGYANRGRGMEAAELFRKMWASGVPADEFTFSSMISGIARLSDNTLGSSTHCCAVKCGLDEYIVVGSALVDMYFKCGKVEEANMLFQLLPEKNLVTWNTMISGYAHNGNPGKVTELFEQLKTTKELKPDEITFLNVISACLHCGLPLTVANHYFEMMISEYMIDPTPEHCSLMIRMMGQEGGHLRKAMRMIDELGFGDCGMVWKALLSACTTSGGSIGVAESAARKVIELDGDEDYAYVMMSNIYASHGKWEEASKVRKTMKERKVPKDAGRSWMRET